MAVGRLVYLTRHFFRHGVRGAYGREIVLPRVFACAPRHELTDAQCEIHVLTSQHDWIMLLWSLRTFYAVSGRRYRLCIHDDGTIPARGRNELQRQFPDARLLTRAEADERMARVLADAPACRRHREKNPLLLKTFDFSAFLEAPRMLVLDCDLLFFNAPAALLERIETAAYARNSFNRDWRYGYSIPWEELTAAPGGIEPLINSGLGLLHAGAIRVDWCEEYFTRYSSLPSHPHRIEQTLIALCAARSGYEMLPAEYDVHDGPTNYRLPVRHYSGAFRWRMFAEGARFVWRSRRHLL